MKRMLLTVGLVCSLTVSLSAQDKRYVDYKTYPADFSRIVPGQPVENKPGYLWGYDGLWFMFNPNEHSVELPAQNPLIESLKRGLDWVCFNWEDNTKVTVGGHPDVILMTDTPATQFADRQICLGFEKTK